jgi:hypothetical protein
MVLHLAVRPYTACGKLVCGNSFTSSNKEFKIRRGLYIITGAGKRSPIQHTAIPEFVTCKQCKTTREFKKKVADSDK